MAPGNWAQARAPSSGLGKERAVGGLSLAGQAELSVRTSSSEVNRIETSLSERPGCRLLATAAWTARRARAAQSVRPSHSSETSVSTPITAEALSLPPCGGG